MRFCAIVVSSFLLLFCCFLLLFLLLSRSPDMLEVLQVFCSWTSGAGLYALYHPLIAVSSGIIAAYCQGFLPCLFLPFQSIHLLHFFKNLSQFFPVLALRIKWVTLLDAGSRAECPRHINRHKKKPDLWKDDDL